MLATVVQANVDFAGVSPRYNSGPAPYHATADHGYFRRWREGDRRIRRYSSDFTIILSEGRPRQCRLAWRIGCEFGAQFVD